MKKSDYVTERTRYWSSRMPCIPSYSGEIEARVKMDVEAAEAAGIEWDEEAPYRIELSRTFEILVQKEKDNDDLTRIGFVYQGMEFYGHEIVYRYNHFLSPEMYMKIKTEWIQSLSFIIVTGTSTVDPIRTSLLELLAWLRKGAGESR